MPTLVRRLPGFLFEAQSAPPDAVLPRMDVALFVGFAASGPINVPVAVEQISEFTEIFGDDLALALDLVRGEQQYAHLGPSVRAFFRNGGRRCWIVRVAGSKAESNRFPLAGLAHLDAGTGRLRQAQAVARSEGSWSDDLMAATVIDSQSVPFIAISTKDTKLSIDVAAARGLLVGDLLRLTFERGERVAFGAIAAIAPTGGGLTRLTLDTCLWFAVADQTPQADGVATFLAPNGALVTRPAIVRTVPPWRAGAPVTIDLELQVTDAVPSGTFISATFSGAELAFVVTGLAELVAGAGSPRARVRGSALWRTAAQYTTSPPPSATVERLQLELRVKRGDAEPMRLEGLGLARGPARFWGTLPIDAVVYAPLADPALRVTDAAASPANTTRFPLAGTGSAVDMYIPIGEPLLPDYLGAFVSAAPAVARDGLDEFDPAIFLDDRLVESQTNTLYAQAEFVRYQSAVTIQPLRGIHAAFFIDDITMVAVPDAVHRRWSLADETHVGPDSPPHLPPEVERVEPDCPPAGDFRPCDPCVVPAPSLIGSADTRGRITLSWNADADAFVLEESVGPEFAAWVTLINTPRTDFVIYDRPAGEYVYRVTAARGGLVSAPSNVVMVRIPGRRRTVLDEDGYDKAGLLDVQRALLRMCAARGDLVGVLGLPDHYRENEAIDHVRALTSASDDGRRRAVAPLTGGEESAFSYAAVYHPWLIVTESNAGALRRVPPDGGACGILARRALERGAWIAPANEALRGVVALTPPLLADRRLELMFHQINVVRQEPRGFVTLSADTLSRDADLRPLNVRRLLILLRRRALQVGSTYVFEPNDDALRRMIQRGFEEALGELHSRGAFAGTNAATSFQVVTDASLNTAQARERGQFIVELRVAPSVPMTFLTLRLVQTGDRLTVIEGR